MKRVISALVLLMVTAPAWAEVGIGCPECTEPNVIISFVNTEPQHVRTFALDITAEGKGKIIDVNCVSADYYLSYVYPAAVEFNDTGEVTNWGLRDANGQGVATITVQLDWLYDPNDPDHNTPPADQGDLLIVTVDKDYCTSIEIDENELLGSIVMQDGNSIPLTCSGPWPLPECSCWVGLHFCMDCMNDPDFDMWYSVGCPNSWCFDCFDCGDTDGDCQLSFSDVSMLIAGWPPNPYLPDADVSKDGQMTFADVAVLINNWPPAGGCDNCANCTPIP